MTPPLAPLRRIRLLAVVGVLACLALGLGLQLLDRSPVIDLLGSVLYVMLVGLLVLLVRPSLSGLRIAAIALGIATVVELLQLTPIPTVIVESFPPARLVLGSAFDPLDLVAYLAGALLLIPLVRVVTRTATVREPR
jgi:Protein of unknown function (DUF2809)